MRDAVIYEFITIKTRQSVRGTKPKIATRIRNDLEDGVARQTISRGVGSDWKLFGAALRKRTQNQQEDGNNSLHGATFYRISGFDMIYM